LSVFRFFQIQTVFYEDGICQSKVITALDNALLKARTLKEITTVNIFGDLGTKTYVATRTVFGRAKNGPYKGLIFSFSLDNTITYDLNLYMDASCELYAK
jgi:hypothetical protein